MGDRTDTQKGKPTKADVEAIPHLGWSSHVYPLDAVDVARLPDYEGPAIPDAALPSDAIIVYIRPDGPDVLLRGRGAIEDALRADQSGAAPVRIVFKPRIPKWNIAATMVRVLRNPYRYYGTGRYHIAAAAVRAMGLERAIRTLDNPQKRGKSDRLAQMDKLEKSLKENGYDDSNPIKILLCRTGGRLDSLRQGHHRVSACLACGVQKMSVIFSAAGALPAWFGRNAVACDGHRISMTSVQTGEQLGGGLRRVCLALPGGKLCLKSYRTDDELDALSREREANGRKPIKQSVVREIHTCRFLRGKNTNVQEFESWKEMKERLPADIMAVFPKTMELVCDSMRGWSLVEERIDNFDGRPLRGIMHETRVAPPEVKSRLLASFRSLRDNLARHRVPFFDPPNVMVQWLDESEFRLRIVDFEPAVRTFLSIERLVPFMLSLKVRRRFNRWLTKMENQERA